MSKVSGSVKAKGAAIDQEIEAANVVVEQVVDEEVVQQTEPPKASPDSTSGAGTDQVAEPTLSPHEEARGLIDVALGMVLPFFPSLESVYDEAAKDRLARAAAPLMAKYGMSVGSMFAKWKEEIEFGFVALPLLLKTVQVLKAEREAKAAAEAAKKPPRAAAPDGGDEVEGHLATKAPASTSNDVQQPLVMS